MIQARSGCIPLTNASVVLEVLAAPVVHAVALEDY